MKISFKTPYQREPERVGGVRIPYAKGRRDAARWRWYIIVLVVSSPLLYLLLKILLSYLIVAAPGYLSLEKMPVSSNSTVLSVKSWFLPELKWQRNNCWYSFTARCCRRGSYF